MTLLKYLLFEEWELPVCNSHVSLLVDRASWQYLWYGQWLMPRKMSLYTNVGWAYSSWFSFIPSLCMQACNQFLHGYFKCAFHILFQTVHRKKIITCVCSVVKVEALCVRMRVMHILLWTLTIVAVQVVFCCCCYFVFNDACYSPSLT